MTMQGLRRWLLRVGIGLLVLVLLWVGLCYRVVQNPTVNTPTNADAVVVLGAPSDERIKVAMEQITAGRSHQLVISGALKKQTDAYRLCHQPPTGVTVSCFVPDPPTTRGEAEYVRGVASVHGWKTIIVVTSRYHISRARLIMDRCFAGRVEMLASHEEVGFQDWAYQYFYQSAGYVKAFEHQAC